MRLEDQGKETETGIIEPTTTLLGKTYTDCLARAWVVPATDNR